MTAELSTGPKNLFVACAKVLHITVDDAAPLPDAGDKAPSSRGRGPVTVAWGEGKSALNSADVPQPKPKVHFGGTLLTPYDEESGKILREGELQLPTKDWDGELDTAFGESDEMST